MQDVINNRAIYKHLDSIFNLSQKFPIEKTSKWVIFSDLHMGDGSKKDDFKLNAPLYQHVLENFYLTGNFQLILNGDIEELQKFSYSKIQSAWPELYKIFDCFNARSSLYKIIGNHDMGLLLKPNKKTRYPLHHGIRLYWKDQPFFVFHGHQASVKYMKYNHLLGVTLKYLATPLRIKNFSVSHNSRKQFKIEKMVYLFSVSRKIASIIGHTHRPLFESMYKPERLKYKIEELCRQYIHLGDDRKAKKMKKSIRNYKKELVKIRENGKDSISTDSIYNTFLTIPCLYNSGCAIGKRGITALEIENGMIRLVHWFDKKTSKKYLKNYGYDPVRLDGTDYYRMIINEESLDYIFTRITLLA